MPLETTMEKSKWKNFKSLSTLFTTRSKNTRAKERFQKFLCGAFLIEKRGNSAKKEEKNFFSTSFENRIKISFFTAELFCSVFFIHSKVKCDVIIFSVLHGLTQAKLKCRLVIDIARLKLQALFFTKKKLMTFNHFLKSSWNRIRWFSALTWIKRC